MSNKLNNSIETIIEGNPAENHILSFLVPETTIIHTYHLNEFSFKDYIPLNIAKAVVNDAWNDKQSLIVIYDGDDESSVYYFMVSHDDKDSFVLQYGDFNEYYNQAMYRDIKGKSKETLIDCIHSILSDMYIESPETEDDGKEEIKNMIPIEELEFNNEHVKCDVMNHIHSFFDGKFSIYRLDMLKYIDNGKSKVILNKYNMYRDIEDCIKTKKAVIIAIPNDMADIENTYILGKYYDKLYHIEIGRYNRFSSRAIPRYMIVTGKVSRDIDFVTEIDAAVLNFNTCFSLPALNE